MRKITSILSCLLAASTLSHADVLLGTRAEDTKTLDTDETYILDLGDYFQLYAEPGPVATFTLRLPVETGFQDLLYKTTGAYEPDYNPEGPTANFMTYELSDGSTYGHAYDPQSNPTNFVWESPTVEFQLLAESVPGTVSNFIQYINDGAYDKTIVHRNESKQRIPEWGHFLQVGSYQISDSEDKLFKVTPNRAPIEFEESVDNAAGTLSMARTNQGFNTATSGFFINVEDNTEIFGKAYSVFAELLNTEASMPHLERMTHPFIYKSLTDFGFTAFGTIPMYTPFWLEKDNYLQISDITVPEGTREGVTYSVELADLDGNPDETSDEEAARWAAYDIQIVDGQLQISRTDTAVVVLNVTGTVGEQTRTFSFAINGYNAAALDAFPVSIIETGGFLENFWYGHLIAETYPYITHDNHGLQWVSYTTDAESGDPEVFYFYDYNLQSWIYTTPASYPLMYIYGWDTYARYALSTGNGKEVPRWFYNYTTEEWVSEF